MSSVTIFLVQTGIVLALPLTILKLLRLRSIIPPVVVQIMVGIALGPSLFGRFAPIPLQVFFSQSSLTPLTGIALIAVLFFCFTTGLHLDPSSIRGQSRRVASIAAASVLVPMAGGFLAGLWIADRFPEEIVGHISRFDFAVAIGICTGVTALPVLGAILKEMNLLGTRIGHLALALAVANDVALWVFLAILLAAVVDESGSGRGVFATLLALPVYVLFMLRAARPFLKRLSPNMIREGQLSENGLVVVSAVTLFSAISTEAIGLHYWLGAFVAGAVMPEELRKPILDRLQFMLAGVLMPFFFMLTGFKTFIDPGQAAFLQIFLVATAVDVVCKVGGTAIAARLVGESWRTSFALGSLMQTKGLMEVIVLTILLDAGLISSTVFSALIAMAVASTALAMPVTRFVLSWGRRRESLPAAAVVLAKPASGRRG